MKPTAVLILTIIKSLLVGQVHMGLQVAHDKFGPFQIVYKHIDNCGDEDSMFTFHLRNRKISRTTVVVEGEGTIRVPKGVNSTEAVNDDIKLKSVLQQWTPSGWKDNFAVADYGDEGVCTILEKYIEPVDIEKRAKGFFDHQTNATIIPECPFYPGNYSVTGVELSLSTMRRLPKKFFYGQYRLHMHFYYKDKDHEVGCAAIYADLIPKNGRT